MTSAIQSQWSPAVGLRSDAFAPAAVPPIPIERIYGLRFRAMATLLVHAGHYSSLYALSEEVQTRLQQRGQSLHRRTVRRYLSGEVASIPPEAVEVLGRILAERAGIWSEQGLLDAFKAAGIQVDFSEEPERPVTSARFLPLVELWLHLNPGVSKRSLAIRLRDDLRRSGAGLAMSHIESLLSGRGQRVRRTLFDAMLVYLAELGIPSEDEAQRAVEGSLGAIRISLADREFVDSTRFQILCCLWQRQHHDASARKLARLLRSQLLERAIDISTGQLLKSIIGKAGHVRRQLVTVLEELLTQALPEGLDLDEAVADVLAAPEEVADLHWVSAEPVAELAARWVTEHPGSSTRQLAMKVSATLHEMGFPRSPNAIQPILGGHNQKTRGYVYRAMAEQMDGTVDASIPEEHIVEPSIRLFRVLNDPLADEPLPPPTEPERIEARGAFGLGALPTAREFILAMLEHHPEAVSPEFVAFAAFRAERLYGIDRQEAEQMIRGEAPPPRS